MKFAIARSDTIVVQRYCHSHWITQNCPSGERIKQDIGHHEPRLAVLIDVDNVSYKVLDILLPEIAKIGNAAVKRVYGDFTSSAHACWKEKLQKYALKPVSQFAYTVGKNASDSALIIDAMDLLYTKHFDGFCIVSSDSDFTGLAVRIREEGLKVYGFGQEKTPEAFRNACSRFIFIEQLKDIVPEKSALVDDSELRKTEEKQKLANVPVVKQLQKKELPEKQVDPASPPGEELYKLIGKAIQSVP